MAKKVKEPKLIRLDQSQPHPCDNCKKDGKCGLQHPGDRGRLISCAEQVEKRKA